MPSDYHSSPVQSWYISVQRELVRNMLLDVAYVGNRADDLLLFANYNQALPNNAAGTIPLPGPAADPELRRHHLRVQRRQVAIQGAAGEVRVADEPRPDAPQRADALEGEGQRSQSLENPNGNFPVAAGLPEPRRGLRRCRPTTSRTTARRASCGRCPSATAGAGAASVAGRSTRWSAAGSSRASTRCTPASRSRSSTRPARRSSCRASRRTSAAPTTTGRTSPATRWHAVPTARSTTGSIKACVVVPTDPSQPFGNASRNSVRGPLFWQFDLAASKKFALGGQARVRVPARGVQPAEPDEFPRAERQPQRRRVRDDHVDLRSAPAAARVQAAVVRPP